MERREKIRYIAYLAVFAALTFVATIAITIPMASASGGYVNFGDTIIFVASALLGPLGGMSVGAIGSVIADLIFAPEFALITLIVKGLEGLIAGLIIKGLVNLLKEKKYVYYVAFLVGFIVGGLEMVLGYYVGGGILLGIMGGDFRVGFATALLDVPSNFIQFGVSVGVGFVIAIGLMHVRYIKNIRDNINK